MYTDLENIHSDFATHEKTQKAWEYAKEAFAAVIETVKEKGVPELVYEFPRDATYGDLCRAVALLRYSYGFTVQSDDLVHYRAIILSGW